MNCMEIDFLLSKHMIYYDINGTLILMHNVITIIRVFFGSTGATLFNANSVDCVLSVGLCLWSQFGAPPISRDGSLHHDKRLSVSIARKHR